MKDTSLIYFGIVVAIIFGMYFMFENEVEKQSDLSYSEGYKEGYNEARRHADDYIKSKYGEVYIEEDGYLNYENPRIEWPEWAK